MAFTLPVADPDMRPDFVYGLLSTSGVIPEH